MSVIAKLWEGSVDDLDGCYSKIIAVMECVHNQDGNFCEDEVLQVAKELQSFTINDMEAIDQLNIDIIDEDDDEYEDVVMDRLESDLDTARENLINIRKNPSHKHYDVLIQSYTQRYEQAKQCRDNVRAMRSGQY